MVFNFGAVLYVCCVLCVFINVSNGQDINSIDSNEVEISTKGTTSTTAKLNVTKVASREKIKLICPSKSARVPLFSLPCRSSRECGFLGPGFLCCRSRCITGVEPPKPEPSHSPIFGFIDRICPIDPMPELLAVQECFVDDDCGPRICCPERPSQGGNGKSYCRNAAPRFNRMPAVQRFLSPLKSFTSYLQCTPAPPPFLDIFPKACESPFDCFPSLCCQENGKKVCRPPKKSFFTLLITAAQNIGTSGFAKSFIQRIS